MVSALGKMGPWNFHLHNACMEVYPRCHRPRHLSESDTATRTAVLVRIMQTVAKICASTVLFTKSVENVGRHNQFHVDCAQDVVVAF